MDEHSAIPPRIFVVEDDDVGRRLLVKILESFGCEVQSVANGSDALEILRNSSFDLVFMDFHMPGLDGPDTTRKIRRLQNDNRDVPVIAVTADFFTRDRCFEAGMNDYVLKPFGREQLQDALFYWLSFESFLLSERMPDRLNRIQPWLLQFVDRCEI